MGREFTVYGLRFSKTSFWNHVNTGFLDPAVATALTACGIETKLILVLYTLLLLVATALTACGIETLSFNSIISSSPLLQQRLPLAVLKLLSPITPQRSTDSVATALTACGIETTKEV